MKLKEIDLYITEKCNLTCEFCSICAGEHDCKEISLTKIQKLINEACSLGVEDIHITGGEPLLHPDILKIISCINEKKINCRLITNGILLTEEKISELKNIGLKNIMISLDGLEFFHDKIRGHGNYKRTLAGITNAIQAGMNVRVNAVAWNENINNLIPLGNYLSEIGVSVYSIFLGSPVGRAEHLQQLSIISAENWMNFLKDIKNSFKKSKMKVVIEKGYIFNESDLFNPHELRSCYNIINNLDYLSIRSNGNIYPCVFFSNSNYHIGNIYTNTLRDCEFLLKNSTFYKSISFIPESCKSCANINVCKGGCKGFSTISNKFNTDNRCKKTNYIPVCPLIKLSISEGKLAACTDDLF